MHAFVFIECAVGLESAVKATLQQLQNVIDVYAVSGGIYDLVVKVEGQDENQLRKVLEEIKRVQGVTSTLTSVIYNKFEII